MPCFRSSFFYWTGKVDAIQPPTDTDANFALTTPEGKNVPAPWAPFTRAGCTVGTFSTANIVLERTPFDVIKVFGANSPQAMESTSTSVKPNQTDEFEGASIHCALSDPICGLNPNAVADVLPDEPGSYTGYQALFGLKYIAPALGGITGHELDPEGESQLKLYEGELAEWVAARVRWFDLFARGAVVGTLQWCFLIHEVGLG